MCGDKWLVGRYETVEEALAAAGKMCDTESDGGLLDGLERTLRIAADGMVDEMPDTFYPVGKIDAFTANLFKLSAQDSVQTIKGYFMNYSSTSVDVGDTMVADFSVLGDIAITVKFQGEKLTEIAFSDGLKNVVRRRLEKQNGRTDDSVLKWLK